MIVVENRGKPNTGVAVLPTVPVAEKRLRLKEPAREELPCLSQTLMDVMVAGPWVLVKLCALEYWVLLAWLPKYHPIAVPLPETPGPLSYRVTSAWSMPKLKKPAKIAAK